MELELNYPENNIDLEEEFTKLWYSMPSKMRVGKKLSKRYFLSTVKNGQDVKNIKLALSFYLSIDRVKRGYIQNATTWLNNWNDWFEMYKENEYVKQKENERKANIKKKYKELLEKLANENGGFDKNDYWRNKKTNNTNFGT